ncbi:hypothetical protein [Mesorhizobium sp. M0199]|uniref:hypothetical protein n=1 Tax=unclassified Mesorhizobium TaxID=325217 RepID=UPI00333A7604
MMRDGWGPFFLALHVATIVFLIAVLKQYHFVDPALYEAVKDAKSADILELASQLGRFDLVSMLLGMFGILLGLGAIVGFSELRFRAREVAGETAQIEARTALAEFLNNSAPSIIRAHVDLIVSPSSSSNGDEVADAYKEEAKDKNG